MPVILVVERDVSRSERIGEALRRDGLSIVTAADRAEALRKAEKSAPGLLLASADTPEVSGLLADFSRSRGGPGAVVLVEESAESSAEDLPADEVLAEPYSDDQLRELVQRWLKPAPAPTSASSPGDGEQLTSEDIFGEVLAEVEADARRSRPEPAARKPALPMKDLERRLEETLSGVIGSAGKDRRPGAARALERPERARRRRPELPDTEIDDLLDQTLSSLDIPTRPRKPPGARPDETPGAAPEPEPTWSAPAFEPVDDVPAPADAASAEDAEEAPAGEVEKAAEERPAEDIGTGAGLDSPAMPGAPAATLDALARRGNDFRTQALPILVPDAEAPEGTPFGDYTLLDRIAVGGMAEVWRARRRGVEGFQKTVAIKKILSNLTGSKDFVTMFIDEAKLAAQLSHNNIIQIYDLGKVGSDFFIAMEHVDGKDLRSILTAAQESRRPILLGLGLVIVSAVARALDYAHRKRDFDGDAMGLVHRDVSPQNVMISYEGSIKLCDFGIVKAVAKASTTQMGALKGKLQYMSPEQAWGKSVDARSDIFSLGSVFYEVLAGHQLFSGDSEIGVLDAVRECRIRSPREIDPEIPEEVARIVLKTLAKSPDERYQTAGDLEHEIREVLDDLRPTPSQKDLAIYMKTLFDISMSGVVALPATGEQPVPPPVSTATGNGPEQPPAVEATDGGRPAAEPAAGRSGRWKWLAAAILAAILAAVGFLALPALTRRDASPPAVESTPPATEWTPEVSPAPLEDPAAATLDDPTGAAGTAPPAEPAPGASDAEPEDPDAITAGGIDIEQLINEELTSRAEQLRRDFEAEKKRIEEELARAKAESEAAEESGTGEDGGGGDGER